MKLRITPICMNLLCRGWDLPYGQAARWVYEIEDALPHRVDSTVISEDEIFRNTTMPHAEYQEQLDSHKDLWLCFKPADKLAARLTLADSFIRHKLDHNGREEVYTTLLGPEKQRGLFAIEDFHNSIRQLTYDSRIEAPSLKQTVADLLSAERADGLRHIGTAWMMQAWNLLP
jgi:hypothetical protein